MPRGRRIGLPVFVTALLLGSPAALADPPTITDLPLDMTVEATGPLGAAVTYTLPTVTDDFPAPWVRCAPASGSTFQLGSTTVTCTATDVVTKETSTAEFTITVADTTPPAFAGIPADISGVEATSALTPVTYTPPTDLVDGSVPVDCDHASGSGFPLGTTVVSCSATDTHGNTGNATFSVEVVDTTPPSLRLPSPPPAEATSAAGAAIDFTVTATDLVDPRPTVSCDHSSGAVFPLGRATVRCRAHDARNNAAAGSFVATVRDTTAPPNVKGLSAKAGNRSIALAWTNPSSWDFDRVVVYRSRGIEHGFGEEVYRGTASRITLRHLRNGVRYRFVVVSLDRADNASNGLAILATPAVAMLYAPIDGATVGRPPVLRWRRVARATYYNVQLYRDSGKVLAGRSAHNSIKLLSAWPKGTRLALKAKWRYQGYTYRLTKGLYRWFVWPGYGSPSESRYGRLLGQGTFIVR